MRHENCSVAGPMSIDGSPAPMPMRFVSFHWVRRCSPGWIPAAGPPPGPMSPDLVSGRSPAPLRALMTRCCCSPCRGRSWLPAGGSLLRMGCSCSRPGDGSATLPLRRYRSTVICLFCSWRRSRYPVVLVWSTRRRKQAFCGRRSVCPWGSRWRRPGACGSWVSGSPCRGLLMRCICPATAASLLLGRSWRWRTRPAGRS